MYAHAWFNKIHHNLVIWPYNALTLFMWNACPCSMNESPTLNNLFLFSLHTLALDLKAKHVQCELVESSFKKIYYSFFICFLLLFILYSFQTIYFKLLIPLPPFRSSDFFIIKANPSLGGTTRNHFKKWLKNQKLPNHFFGPFLLNVFTTIIFFFMVINFMR
jgi:hypothetical protein